MDRSVLVFVSHASEDKESYVDPIVQELEHCYINVWIDTRKIAPGDNLRKSIFRDGLDKADVVLLFFTANALNSSWVDREIKHVLRQEKEKGNDFDVKKVISIFDSKETYDALAQRYPELTDDLLHLMPRDYSKRQLGQLISAIWAKYLSLQGGDVETQRLLLAKDKEIFQKEKDIQDLRQQLQVAQQPNAQAGELDEFKAYVASGKLKQLLVRCESILSNPFQEIGDVVNFGSARAFGLLDISARTPNRVTVTEKGKRFFEWYLLSNKK